ncbi:MAG: hypothetical protein LBD47_03185 [Treponema sp.]|jgi:hypothetical protein|nr:hypothetical protein [Treponema sp.]
MAKRDTRDSLITTIESELKKDAEDIDGGFIDKRVDELYALAGMEPPGLTEAALDAAARAIRARAAWRRRNTQAKAARKRRFTRAAVAVCCLAVFTLSANYLTTLATGSCIPSKAGIKICCGTKICWCDTAKTGHSE